MSLSTNGWDIVYTSKLASVGNLKKNLFTKDEKIIASSFQMEFATSEVEILVGTTATDIVVTMAFVPSESPFFTGL
jgi:hypothetical protein